MNIGMAGIVFIATLLWTDDVYAAAEAGHQILNPFVRTTEAAVTGGNVKEAFKADVIDAISTPGTAELEEETREICGDECVDSHPVFNQSLPAW